MDRRGPDSGPDDYGSRGLITELFPITFRHPKVLSLYCRLPYVTLQVTVKQLCDQYANWYVGVELSTLHYFADFLHS